MHHKLEENQIPTLTCPTASLHLRDANYHSTIIRRIYYELEKPVRYQEMVVASPSLNSPERSGGDGWCWANLQNTHFSGLTRKNPVFERSVLKYVSIKNRILTPSGQKSRVCVNTLDRLPPRTQTALPFLPPHRRAAKPTRQKRPTLACWPLLAGLPEEGIGGRERERRCVCVEKSLPRSCLQDQVRA